MDNCWDYNDGASEIRMGKALRDGYRQRVLLMTKIDGRDKMTAATQIEKSLRRLQTDQIDLLQFHEVIRPSDPERICGPNGTLEAVLAAKQAGKVCYSGFTGHKSPKIHLTMLHPACARQVTFDAVPMPLNVMDAPYDSFEKKASRSCCHTRSASSGRRTGSKMLIPKRIRRSAGEEQLTVQQGCTCFVQSFFTPLP